VGRDLAALHRAQADVAVDPSGEQARCGGWELRRSADGVVVETRPESDDGSDGLDGLRALCGLAWSSHPPSAAALDEVLETLNLN
jgi:hypothetical protein